MNNIKNIIFDLGGVVIDLDRSLAVEALKGLGVADADTLLGEYAQKGPFLLLESGLMSDAQFYDAILPSCKEGTTCTQVKEAFERFLVGLPVERLATLRSLRERGYKVFMLSNTNPVMYNSWIDLAFRQEGKMVNDYFDGAVLSYQERTCKPDAQIFKNLIARYSLNPGETLLLDDSEANCNAARALGLNAIQITKTGQTSFSEVCRGLEEEGPAE